MANTLISSPSFTGTPLPSLPRRHFPHRAARLLTTKAFHQIPPIHSISHSLDFAGIVARTEGLLYTLADAAVVAVDPATTSVDAATQKNGGWFGFISEAMEYVLKVINLLLNSTSLAFCIA